MVSKAQILDHVWQYDFGGDGGVVETYIGYLRRKLDNAEPRLIHTIRGVGYTLRDPRPDQSRPMSLRARLLVGMAVVGVVLVLAAIVDHPHDRVPPGRPGRRPAARGRSAAARASAGPARDAAAATAADDGPVSSFYVGLVDATGVERRARQPVVEATGTSPTRTCRCDDIANLAPGEHAYSPVGSDGGPRYRVLATRPANAASGDRRRHCRSTTSTTPSGGS